MTIIVQFSGQYPRLCFVLNLMLQFAVMRRMMRLYLLLTLMLVFGAACTNQPTPPPVTAGVMFPTMTAGRLIQGPLPPAAPPPADGQLSNPATAIALANVPTATPNFSACPAPNASASLEASAQGGTPRTSAAVSDAIGRYLSDGGNAGEIEMVLRDNWAMLEGGFVRGDLDLTGEGIPEVLVSFSAPEVGGMLLIYVCADGRYTERYQAIMGDDDGGTPPQILSAADLNFNQRPDLLFASQICDADGENCQQLTQLTAWDAARGRFLNLLGGGVRGDESPTPLDVDGDRISELVMRLTNDGDSTTGPLRTGQIVYDWDGASYVRSYTQYDPPRFRIQMIHDADQAFQQGRTRDAIALYDLAINSPALENWLNDDITILPAYARYRMLLAYADMEAPELVEMHAQILQLYPDLAAAPVYAELAIRFWDALQTSANLHSACVAVLETLSTRPEGIGLMNRYGSSSEPYRPETICPY